MKLGAVHRFLGIGLAAEENPRKYLLGDRPLKAVRPVIASNGVLYFKITSVRSHRISGKVKEGKDGASPVGPGHEQRQRKLEVSVTVPPAPVRVPSQRPLILSVTSVPYLQMTGRIAQRVMKEGGRKEIRKGWVVNQRSVSPEFIVHQSHSIAASIFSFLHRFRIIDNPTCTCKKAQQTVYHLIYDCPDIGLQRLKLINQIIQNGDQWPVTNQQLIFRHLRNFCEFVKSMNL